MTQTTNTATKAVLTDGRPIASLTLKKYVKDFVLDFLMSLPSSGIILTAANVGDRAALIAAGFGLGSALTGAFIRTAIKWAQSPD